MWTLGGLNGINFQLSLLLSCKEVLDGTVNVIDSHVLQASNLHLGDSLSENPFSDKLPKGKLQGFGTIRPSPASAMLFLLRFLQYFKTNLGIHPVEALSVQIFKVPPKKSMLKRNELQSLKSIIQNSKAKPTSTHITSKFPPQTSWKILNQHQARGVHHRLFGLWVLFQGPAAPFPCLPP